MTENPSYKTRTLFFLSLFFLSASVLAYEFLLMRILALMVWTPFVNIIISIAMLGFGVSGSLLWLLRDLVKKHQIKFILVITLAFTVMSAACLKLSQSVNFNAFMLLWDQREYFKFLLLAFTFFFPFLIGATGLGAYFVIVEKQAGKVYLFNLFGSAFGVLAFIWSTANLHPSLLGVVVSLMSVIAMTCLLFSFNKVKERLIHIIHVLAASIIALYLISPLKIHISEYKSLSRTLLMPDSKIISEDYNTLGWLTAVESPSFHHMPGVSLSYSETPPEQIGLFLDGELLGAIDKNQNNLEMDSYLRYLPSSLPYLCLKNPSVLIVGARGGSEVIQAQILGASSVDVVEIDGDIREIVDNKLGHFSKRPYSMPKVKFIENNARSFIKSIKQNYDLILFPPAGSEASTVASMSALNENYLFTKESLSDFLHKLNPNGYILLSSWIQYPPKEGIKLFALAVEALEKYGINNPEQHIFAFRSWNMCAIVISKSPLSESFIISAKEFIENNSFDPFYYDGLQPEESNKFNFMEDNPYYYAAQLILSDKREEFYDEHIFNITPSSDDKPFFGNFLKWKSIPKLFKTMNKEWIPFMDWGQLLIVVSLLHAIVIGFIAIFLPLLFTSPNPSCVTAHLKSRMVLYFTSIGVAFFLLEIGFIQRFSLVLWHPFYSSCAVVILFLLGAGFGSLCYYLLGKTLFWNPWRFFIPIVLISLFYMLGLQVFLHYILRYSLVTNFIIAAVLIFPLSFFMGMAFPYGIDKLSEKSTVLIPWAWGVNSYASVLTGIIMPMIAQSGGFAMITALAGFFYLLAALIAFKK